MHKPPTTFEKESAGGQPVTIVMTKSCCRNFSEIRVAQKMVLLEDNAPVTVWRDAIRNQIKSGARRFLFIGRGKPTVNTQRYDGVIITDQINVSGQNPLVGPNEENFGARFPDVSGLYQSEMNIKIASAVSGARLKLQSGIVLIPVNPENLTVLENTLIEQNDIVAITKEIFAGAITAKHAGCLCAGIVLFVTVSGDTVAKIAASLA